MEYVLHPRSEIDARIKRLQERMGELTGAILFESTDLGYFSGTAQDGLIYIPRDGLPTLMIKRSQERARQESPLPVLPQKSHKSLKKDLDLPDGARIGLETDVLPYNNYARLAKALGQDVQFSDISEKIKHIRSVKSDFEIRLIREAARILDKGIATVADNLREGMREIDLSAVVEGTMRLMGHQGKVAFRRFNQALPMGHLMAGASAALPSNVSSPTGGKGMSLFFAQGPGFARIKRNEPVLVDYAGCYNGYIARRDRLPGRAFGQAGKGASGSSTNRRGHRRRASSRKGEPRYLEPLSSGRSENGLSGFPGRPSGQQCRICGTWSGAADR